MKINRAEGPTGQDEERQVYHKGAQPAPKSAPEQKAPAKAEPVQPQQDYGDDDEYEEEAPAKRRFPLGKIIGIVLLLVVAAAVVFGVTQGQKFYQDLDGADELGAEQSFVVEQGSSVAAIAASLREQGLIQYDWLFKYYTKYSGKAADLQYGNFNLAKGMSYNDILKALSEQQVRRATISLTFPEGSTCVDIAQTFVDNGLCDSVQTFLDCANGVDGSDFSQYAFWSQMPEKTGRLFKCEGYLFPETYEFYQDATVYDCVNTMYKEFDARTSDLMATVSEKGVTLDDVVILASFIQEEAGLPAEDPKVSAVFHNRLESDDPLWTEHKLESNASSYIQNDGDNNYLWNSSVARYMGWVDAGAIPDEVLAAYDTYRISGLPAGAISNPGYDAIEASLNPDTDFMAEGYFFFVTGHPDTDVAGQYFYAKTADEHSQNVEKAGWAY